MAANDNNGEVQMSNIKCQLKPQYLMSNFEFCHLALGIHPRPSWMGGIHLAFGFWNLSLNLQFFMPSI